MRSSARNEVISFRSPKIGIFMNVHTRCTNCDQSYAAYKDAGGYGAWWTLNGYHGLWGDFCPSCNDLVSYRNNKPEHPRHFAAIQFKQQVLRQENGGPPYV